MKTIASALKLIVCLAAVAAAAAIGGYATSLGLDEWYRALAKPAWNPPDWLFGPVWTLLYILMALAAWLVWMRGWKAAKYALTLFVVQLILNAAWSWLFFGWRQPGWAFVELVILLAAIIATAVAFARVKPTAAWLLAPYLAWVAFAGLLNFTIWRLNG
jgi:benzodiazapine receptor